MRFFFRRIFLKKLFLVLICAFIALSAAAPARAESADPVLIGNYGGKNGWNAYRFHDRAGEVCFMSRSPEKQEGKFKKRGPVLFFVTRWSSGKDANVISVANGYDFKPKSPVTLAVKGKKFDLIAQGDKAWTKDQTEDNAVIKELLAGAALTVRGTSSHGTSTTDTYSLKGSTEAWQAITKECAEKK
jgi:hypothetical protein